jgi:hypothetical protein
MSLKLRFLIKSGYYIVPSPYTALASSNEGERELALQSRSYY